MSKPTTHTAETYRAKYVRPGPNASLARLLRYVRMLKREAAHRDRQGG